MKKKNQNPRGVGDHLKSIPGLDVDHLVPLINELAWLQAAYTRHPSSPIYTKPSVHPPCSLSNQRISC